MATKKVKNTKAFARGLGRLPMADQQAIKAELMQLIGITTRISWRKWRDGLNANHPTPAERIAIEGFFAKHNLSPDQVWGL